MNAPADLRAFHWPAQALHVKLHIALQQSRAALAQAVQARDEQEETIARLERLRVQEEERMARRLLRPDPRSYVHLLARLAQLQADAARLARDHEAARRRVDAALAACIAQDRAVRLVDDLRSRAERVYLSGQQRRAAAEADAAWLGRPRAGGAR